MVISAITGGNISRLLSKTVGQSVEGGSKIIGEKGLSIFAPNNAKTYDLVKGIGKKGEFQLFAFKDESGNVIQHYTRYLKDGNKYTDVIIDTDKSTGIINHTRKTINGTLNSSSNIEQIEHSSMLPFINPADGKLSFQKSFMTMTPNGDFGGQEVLRQGKKAVGLRYKYNWDGTPTNIEYKNTLGKKLDITEGEGQYLPFVNRRICLVEQNGQQVLGSQDFTLDRVNEKIGLAQIIQEKLYGIKKNLLPRAKAVKENDLVAIKVTGKTGEQLAQERGGMHILGEALPNGQIHITTDLPYTTDGLNILQRVSHEMQHEADFIAMNKGGEKAYHDALQRLGKTNEETVKTINHEKHYYDSSDFQKKCAEINGTFAEGTPEYNEAVKLYEMNLGATNLRDLKDLASHDAMSFEQRAINREQEQLNMLQQISLKVGNFLSQFIS